MNCNICPHSFVCWNDSMSCWLFYWNEQRLASFNLKCVLIIIKIHTRSNSQVACCSLEWMRWPIHFSFTVYHQVSYIVTSQSLNKAEKKLVMCICVHDCSLLLLKIRSNNTTNTHAFIFARFFALANFVALHSLVRSSILFCLFLFNTINR